MVLPGQTGCKMARSDSAYRLKQVYYIVMVSDKYIEHSCMIVKTKQTEEDDFSHSVDS